MNKKGIVWNDVKNLLLVLVVIALILWMLGGTVVKGVIKQNDCVKNSGYCAEVCGPGSYQMAQYKCDKKEQSCCYDELAVRGKKPEKVPDATNAAELSCADVQLAINNAYKTIWQNMAIQNPDTSLCRVTNGNFYSQNPCDKKYSTCTYTEKTNDCETLAALVARRGEKLETCKEPTTSS